MKKARALISTIAATLIVGSVVIVTVAPRFKKVERRAGPMPEVVQTTVSRDLPFVTKTIQASFNGQTDLPRGTHKLASEETFSRFYLFPSTDPIFPDDFQIQHLAAVDPDLRRYAALSSEERKSDFYLYEPTGDYYWPSDYYYNDVPAKFHCAFIIHLASDTDASTRVAVFEYSPTIWVGERIGFSAHGFGPASFHDIRFVQSTLTDRTILLNKIMKAAD